jgi:hypothetical protein
MRTVTVRREELWSLAAEVLGQGARLAFRARGGSMRPWIREGDLLTAAPLEAGGLRLGEIALYRTEAGALLAHRVIGQGQGHWLARGDAAWGPVEIVPMEWVLGRVVLRQRRGRRRRLDTPWARLAARLWHALWPWNLRAYSAAATIRRRLLPEKGPSPDGAGR